MQIGLHSLNVFSNFQGRQINPTETNVPMEIAPNENPNGEMEIDDGELPETCYEFDRNGTVF